MIATVRHDDPALALLLAIDTTRHEDLRIANSALRLIGAELDEESPLTPVFVRRRTEKECPDGVA